MPLAIHPRNRPDAAARFMEVSRQLAAIVVTDLAGFTALAARDESAAFAALELQRSLLKPLVAEHGGEWLKELGEGLLLSFPSSVKAANCAVAIQQATAEGAQPQSARGGASGGNHRARQR
ncbi:MAG: hypothetical protein VCB81_00500, partial [Verrucomicrobiia bacterium]